MSKQVQPVFFDLHVKGFDPVAKAGSNLGGVPARASGIAISQTLIRWERSHDR